MPTITIKTTSPFFSRTDVGAPSALDIIVSGSSNAILPNGTYDGWCLNPFAKIVIGDAYASDYYNGVDLSAYTTVGLNSITTGQINQINWMLAQDFTADPSYGGQFNFGEVQAAIWDILGYKGYLPKANDYLTNKGALTLNQADIDHLKSLAANAQASGESILPAGSFFTVVIDPTGDIQPIIAQLRSAKLGDYVWEDTDADGIQDSSESGVNGVTVNLLDANGNIIATTTTGDDLSTAQVEKGFYQFTGLNAGQYRVHFVEPADFVAFTNANANNNTQDAVDSDADINGRSQLVTLSKGGIDMTLDAGLIRGASLGDRVWLDKDGDGQQDVGEDGVAGVKVLLCDALGNPTGKVAATNSNGNYLFSGLLPGTYTVKFELPSGYEFTRKDNGADASDSDADQITGKSGIYTLASGESNLTLDAGVLQRAHLGDRIWEDTNANGEQDAGEVGIGSVKVHLKDANGQIIASTTTDANGIYGFDVLPGTYSIQIEKPAGYQLSPNDVGTDTSDSDIDVATLTSQQVTLQSGETNLSVDGGLYNLASLGDRVWLDKNGDGQQDAGEDGVSGVKILLCDALGNATGISATTDSNGNYLFTDLVPGTYSVKFELPAGYEFTRKDQGADVSDSDADQATGKTGTYTLASGEGNLTVDAGVLQRTHLGDRIWEDKNANGRQDADESGIASVKVYLKDVNGQIIASTTTDANGIYGFDVLPGTYSIQIEKPTGYQVSLKDVGSDTSDSDVDAVTLMSQQVTLQSGETNLSVDGGLYKLAEIGDRVWHDRNGNGRQDAGEEGLGNVTVQLKDAQGMVISTQATDAQGNYLFTGLRPGTYSLGFIPPDGYEFTKRNVGDDLGDSDTYHATGLTEQTILTSGESDLSWDAGLVLRARLGDRIWEDKNANGQQDSGESGIANVRVYLKDANGQIIRSTTTDANGIYGFDVLPGTYSIQIEKPAGYQVSPKDKGADTSDSDIDTATLMSQQVTLESGDTNLTVDGGLYRLAQIGDRVWHDRNGNGRQDAGDEGIGNVTVQLRDSQGAVISTQTTDAQGNYLFTGLRPGTYSVGFVAPTGYEFTLRNVGDDAGDSDPNRSTGITSSTTLVSGESDLTWDAGLVHRAHLGDRIWEDKNANGQQDAAESGIASVKVYLKDVNGQIIASTTTDANGIYGFDVLPGTYSIQIEKPAGYQVSPKDVGSDTGDSDIDAATLMSQQVTLQSGDNDLGLDGGLYKLASLGDRVWLDKDGDGQQDAGEDGVSGVKVMLCDALGNPTGQVVTTNSNGNYLFSGLLPGRYSVKFELPSGYEFTRRDQGTDASDSDADQAAGKSGTYTLASGESNLTVDAGVLQRAHLGDRIWEDKNANGQQDAGESGIGSVKVYLKDVNGQIIASTTTDANGIYGFDVLPGTYSIQIEKPTGHQVSLKDVGSDTSDSDVDAVTLMSQQVTLQSGETNLSVDGGLYKLAEIGDRVWHDRNGNGRQDAGEEGLGNVTVQLKDAQGMVISTQTTDAQGNYLFMGLRPATYSLGFIAPSGYVLTKQDIGDDAGDSDANRITGATAQTDLSSGESDRTWDAGLYRKASIGDHVWVDRDHDNIQDVGEPGVAKIKVSLQDANGTTVATTLTDLNGNYLFNNLDPGTYRLVFDKSDTIFGGVDLSTWRWAKMDVGNNDAIDADAYSTTDVAVTQYTTLESGENDMTWDAGVTPLVIDLNGDGVHTVARADAKGVFDLLGTGHGIASGWASAQDGMLAVDLNGNGRIDNIHELFGGHQKGDAFAKLATYDSNGDGQVDAQDENFAALRIWRDANGNHATDAGELMSLQDAGVASLKAHFVELPFIDAQGNLHLERSNAVLSDGTTVDMTDVYFNVAREDATTAGVQLTSLASLLGDDRSLDNLLAGPSASQKAGVAPAVAMPDVIDSHYEVSRTILSQLDRHDSPSGM